MCVFNYAAIKIQQQIRGFLSRRRQNPKKQKSVKSKVKRRLGNKQLDKYLTFLDECKSRGRMKPYWLDEGYSSWCAVRIQACARMRRVRKKYLFNTKLINQVASIIIQTAWRNRLYRTRIAHMNALPKNVIHDVFIAAEIIQMCWRTFCNRRVYRYFRDLVTKSLKGAPFDLLRSIIPNEAHCLDRASGVHVRFRLGGRVFPPKIYFKIYTHRPLCDVNAFAPRNYVKERIPDPDQVLNRSSTIVPKATKVQALRVGARYFGAVVSTTSTTGTSDWYKRDEQNDWRPIASHMFENVATPPWFKEISHTSRPKAFHFSKLRREEDLIKARKRRRRQWMVKAYLLSTTAAAHSLVADSKKKNNTAHDRTNLNCDYSTKLEFGDDRRAEQRPEYNSPSPYSGSRVAESKGSPDNNNRSAVTRIQSQYAEAKGGPSGTAAAAAAADKARQSAADFKRSFSDSSAFEAKSSSNSVTSLIQQHMPRKGLFNNLNTSSLSAQPACPSYTNLASSKADSAKNNGVNARRSGSPLGKSFQSDHYVDLVDWR